MPRLLLLKLISGRVDSVAADPLMEMGIVTSCPPVGWVFRVMMKVSDPLGSATVRVVGVTAMPGMSLSTVVTLTV